MACILLNSAGISNRTSTDIFTEIIILPGTSSSSLSFPSDEEMPLIFDARPIVIKTYSWECDLVTTLRYHFGQFPRY